MNTLEERLGRALKRVADAEPDWDPSEVLASAGRSGRRGRGLHPAAMLVAAAGTIALVLVGFGIHSGSSPEPAGPPTAPVPTSTAPSPTRTPTPTPPAIPRTVDPRGRITYDVTGTEGAAFESPMGNLHCALLSGRANQVGSSPLAACVVNSPRYAPPTAPAGTDCPSDYGYGIGLQQRASLLCGDPVLGMADLSDRTMAALTRWFDPAHNPGASRNIAMLGYGNSIRFRQFLCTSLRSGVRCTNTDDDRWFVLSPDRWAIN